MELSLITEPMWSSHPSGSWPHLAGLSCFMTSLEDSGSKRRSYKLISHKFLEREKQMCVGSGKRPSRVLWLLPKTKINHLGRRFVCRQIAFARIYFRCKFGFRPWSSLKPESCCELGRRVGVKRGDGECTHVTHTFTCTPTHILSVRTLSRNTNCFWVSDAFFILLIPQNSQ